MDNLLLFVIAVFINITLIANPFIITIIIRITTTVVFFTFFSNFTFITTTTFVKTSVKVNVVSKVGKKQIIPQAALVGHIGSQVEKAISAVVIAVAVL